MSDKKMCQISADLRDCVMQQGRVALYYPKSCMGCCGEKLPFSLSLKSLYSSLPRRREDARRDFSVLCIMQTGEW